MVGLDVVCPGCRKSFHTTTQAFNPYKTANGAMLHLKDPWRKWGWCSFGDASNGLPPALAERPDTYWSMMDCPGCGTPLAPSGRLTVTHPDGSEFVPPDEEFYKPKETGPVIEIYTDEDLEREWDERMSSNDPQFVCEVCGKACKSPLGLHSHMRSHEK
jgi:hypothetical protein